MKTILCVHQGYELYGSDRTFIQSVTALRQAYPDAALTVHLPQQGKLSDALIGKADRFVYGRLSVFRRGSFRLSSLYQLIKNIRFNQQLVKESNLVYINSAVVFSYVFLSFFRKERFILHIHEIPTGLAKLYFCLISLFTRALCITNSQATKSALCASDKARVLYNGVKDIPKQVPVTLSGDNRLSLLLIGRLNSWKGQDIAIEAMSLLANQGKRHIHLNIVGSYFGNHRHYLTALQDMVVKYGLDDQVHFHHFSDNPSGFYHSCDVVLVPSTQPEPFGLVAIEGMNFNKPVIATNHGGLTEIVRDNQTGFLIAPGSADDLAAAILRYDEDRALMTKHGQAGKIRFQDYFLEESYTQNFLAIVKQHVA